MVGRAGTISTTDPKIVDEVVNRGVEAVYPSREYLVELLRSGKRLRVYFGIDPTGPTLHLGHVVSLLKLRQFQRLGHHAIILIGDFTGKIGDPTGKLSARQKLDSAQARENAKLYKSQASLFLDFSVEAPAEMRYNSEWLGALTLDDALSLASHLTVQKLIKRDMFEERMAAEQPIYLHEFLYPLLQGYDSTALEVDGEVGGNDQTFNMLVGRDLLKVTRGREKFVVSMKLIIDQSGRKMGKTEGNLVALTDSSEEMFGKIMSWPDSSILRGFDLLTDVPQSFIAGLSEKESSGVNLRDAKLSLASEIVSKIHGERGAREAKESFTRAFQEGGEPTSMLEVKVRAGTLLSDTVYRAGLVKSKSEYRRLLSDGAVSFVGRKEKIRDPHFKLSENTTVRIGAARFLRVVCDKIKNSGELSATRRGD